MLNETRRKRDLKNRNMQRNSISNMKLMLIIVANIYSYLHRKYIVIFSGK